MNKLQEIFIDLIKRIEKDPSIDVEKAMRKAFEERGLSQDTIDEMVKALNYIDDFEKKAAELEKAKEDGRTTAGWLESQLDDATKNLTDEQKETFFSQLDKPSEN